MVVQDALANFIDIMSEIPNITLSKRAPELLDIMIDKLKYAQIQINPSNPSDLKRIMVCNNACWAIGEMANLVPDQVKAYQIKIINLLAEILN